MATYESKKYATIPIAATQVADGSVTDAEFQFINTLASNAQTQITARAPLAGATFTGGVRINDSQNLNIGSGTDLVISHDTNNSKINNTTGELRIAGDSIKLMNQAEDETHLTATADGAVGLRHNNVEKLVTSASGVTVSGTLAATAVTGDASGMSNLPTGPTGPTGPSGPTGPTGPSGPTGPAGTSGIAASATDVGAIREFQFRSTGGNLTSGSVSVGTSITLPYTSGSLGLKDGSDVTTGGSNAVGPFAVRGLVAGIGSFAGGSNTSLAGTWRCLTSPKTGTFTTGTGQNAVTRGYSLPGLFQRIS
mgnify:CR=1 FL=1